MWAFGLIGVFTPMFLLLPAAVLATAAAIRAAFAYRRLSGALAAAALIALGAAALVALALALVG
jgi:hypothetical protein